MADNKIYEIAGKEFILKTDLTLDESIEVQKLMQSLSAKGNTISGSFSGDETKKFLCLILGPVDQKVAEHANSSGGNAIEASFFGKTKESVRLEIFKDFFLDRIRKAESSAGDFARSILQLEK